MRHGLRAFVVFACVFCFFPFQTDAALSLLTQDLQKGMTSSEVKILQEFLNTDTATRVSLSGIGSKGFETTYFGSLTETAVRKFQEKYKGELSLSGTYLPNGKVDLRTRGKMNNLILAKYLESENISSKTVSLDKERSSNSNYLSITSIKPENSLPGETIDVYGTGFTRNSKVYLGIDKKISFEYVSSKHIKIKAPNISSQASTDLLYIVNHIGDTRWTQPIFPLTTKTRLSKNSNKELLAVADDIRSRNKDFYDKEVAMNTDSKKISWKGVGNLIGGIFSAGRAHAFATNSFYGGGISSTEYCTCYYSPYIILDIDDKASSMTYTTAYSPSFSRLHSNYNIITSGPNVVGGTMQSQVQCEDTEIIIPPPFIICEPDGNSADTTIDMLRGTGTSYF